MNILHITGHLGGGVGTVVLSYLVDKSASSVQRHTVVSLDYLNPYATEQLSKAGIEKFDKCHSRIDLINEKIQKADVVLLHWWNHPLITDLLVRNKLPACRLALWSHISGSPAPNCFTKRIFEYPDEFVFTTPLSYFDPEFFSLPDTIKTKVSAIWSTGGVERLSGYLPAEHSGFNIGYIGNLDLTKIHPDFVNICRKINIPDVRFTIVGPLNDALLRMADEAGLANHIRFTGFISEEQKWDELCRFDVFGYPLAPHHYGTCDQTLQEAMALGIVPVVLDNPMESYIVKHGETGLVAHSISDYVESVHLLYRDKKMRTNLSIRARDYALSEYSLSRMSESWDKVFTRLMMRDKQEKLWPGSNAGTAWRPHQVFLESLGSNAGVFTEYLNPTHVSKSVVENQIKALGSKYNWRSENKSTVHQYLKFFPDDSVLAQWSRLMKEGSDFR